LPATEPTDFKAFGTTLAGRVSTASDADWDSARQAFNLAVDQRPAAVVLPANERDVTAVVRFAREHDFRVAPQSTGHNAIPLGSLDGSLLLKTTEMGGADGKRVEIDAEARSARVLAGTTWGDVVEAAAGHGLAALHGSSGTVGVVGYSLGGGIGWYARKQGLQTNSVTAIELVTADGETVRADHDTEPELFWALRGGGGNFGVVIAMEFELYPVTEVYAGMMLFDWERSAEVLHAWNELLPSLPDELTSLARILQVPDLEQIPEIVRGGKFAAFEAAFLGSEADGAELVKPLRDLGPDIDTFGMVPAPALSFLHMDPPEPVPGVSGHGLYEELPSEAIDALVEVAGPGSGSPLVSVELRHTGGALARSGPDHGALASLDGSLCMYAVGMAPDAAAAAPLEAQIEQAKGVLKRHHAGATLNFTEQQADLADVFPDDSYRRLQKLRGELDPDSLFKANHEVKPGA
jgi:hypothetical protein